MQLITPTKLSKRQIFCYCAVKPKFHISIWKPEAYFNNVYLLALLSSRLTESQFGVVRIELLLAVSLEGKEFFLPDLP